MALPQLPVPLRPSSRSELVRAASRLLGLVGGTPVKCFHIGCFEFCVKLEYVNPTGSHKDRIAVYMIRGLAREGELGPGGCVGEFSSGNTAAAVAWAARMLGLRARLYVERGVSEVKRSLIRAFGGEVVEVEAGEEGRKAALEDMERRGCVYLNQSGSRYNWLAHYETTGAEVVRQLGYRVDVFVMGVGTGGTVTGVGWRLREEVGSTLIAAVAPEGSPLAGGGGAVEGGIEGLAGHSIPPLYTAYGSVVDRVVPIHPRVAARWSLHLLDHTGIAAGPSTGAAFAAAWRLVEEGVVERGSRILIIAADHMARYPELLRLAGSMGW